MKLSNSPKKMSTAFGINGQRQDLQDSAVKGTSLASYNDGFPPITMISKDAGGIPPQGKDFNQIFYELSSNAQWSQASGIYPYDTEFSAAIGGYPKGSVVLGLDGITIYQSTTDDNIEEPGNDDSWTEVLGDADKFDFFAGNYEDGSITVTKTNSYIVYDGYRWYPKTGVSLPFRTTGTDSTSWLTDSVNFIPSGATANFNPEMQVTYGDNLLSLPKGTFDVPTSERWGISGIKFGGGSTETSFITGPEGMKMSVVKDGLILSDGIMFPTVKAMNGMTSPDGLIYKLVEFPADGYEGARQGTSLFQAYRNDGVPAWYITTPGSNRGYNQPIGTSGPDGYKLATTDELEVVRPVYGYTDSTMVTASDQTIKLCSISTQGLTTLPLETGSFVIKGGWDREHLSEELLITMNALSLVSVSDISTMTASDWSDHFRVFCRGQTYLGTSAERVRVYVEIASDSVDLYAIIPSTFYGFVSEYGFRGNVSVTTYINSMEYSGDFNITKDIEVYRHTVLDTFNSAACSDGVRVSSDSHIRIVSYDSTISSLPREITNDNFYWAGNGTTNAYKDEKLTIVRSSVGVYTVDGVSGFWNGTVRLRQPFDENGEQVAIAEVDGYSNTINVYEIAYTFDPSTNKITRGKGDLMDIPTNSWVDAFYYANWS